MLPNAGLFKSICVSLSETRSFGYTPGKITTRGTNARVLLHKLYVKLSHELRPDTNK